jgi:hypothetical protein
LPNRYEQMYLQLKEAGSAADFPNVLGNTLNRILLDMYAALPTSWNLWCKTQPNIQDFKENKRIKLTETDELEEVRPGFPAKESSFDESAVEYVIKKFERVFGIPWEYLINDDVGAIQQRPEAMGRAAAITLAKFAVALLVSRAASSTVTTALSKTTLAAALTEFKTRTDARTGNVINVVPKYLIVPPALEITGREILKSVRLIAVGVGGSAAVQSDYNGVNEVDTQLSLAVEPYLTDSNNWYLAADPKVTPGIEIGFFRGRTQPRTFVKSAGIQGVDNPFENGDFETGSIEYKVQHIFGGAVIDTNALLKVEVSGS